MNDIPHFFHKKTNPNLEVNEWLKKTKAVSSTIRNLANGKLDPSEINLKKYGIYTPEQEKEEQERKRIVKLELDQKERIQQKKEKQQEHEKWWNGASLISKAYATNHHEKDVITINRNASIKERYSSDYSRWEEGKYIPDDEATKDEIEEIKKEKEKAKAKQFELSHPEFCKSVIQDIEERQITKEKRTTEAKKHRLHGNQCYLRKKYDKALLSYQKALMNDPYNEKILMNIALCYSKQEKYDDAIEFCNRVCHIHQDSSYLVKALFHKAKIQWQINPNSMATLNYFDECLALDPQNKEIINTRRLYVLDMKNKERENTVLKLSQTKKDDTKSLQKQSNTQTLDTKSYKDILQKNLLECIDKITDTLLKFGCLTTYSKQNDSRFMDRYLLGHEMTPCVGILLTTVLHSFDLGRVLIRINGKLEPLVFLLKSKMAMCDESMNKNSENLDLEIHMLMNIVIECIRNEPRSRDIVVKVSLNF